ncbi:GNAT family N-acetyltransferase [Xenorhabdus eapokensis]|uniref:GNAT family acetyltransferase n=1 Tax=Xenorhabdus eapokensis TaxID=1873482 RepID=A0A1Q5TGQ2_9GAMM|nr:GNAT family N-acetyltransferase [Xenorhabdus eapokensis]OKO99427.1 GNAT family acetyltransferase [Xenorhabdus eapokensis]
MSDIDIEIKEIKSSKNYRNKLITLLTDCVDDGASIGFIAPLKRESAVGYWSDVDAQIKDENCRLLIALKDAEIVGSVQIGLTKKDNGKHRGEIEKLMVKRACRSVGIGTLLMSKAEELSTNIGLRLLVLDTREGDVSEKLYAKRGFTRVGAIPGFALSSNGNYDGTVIYYKEIF